jgi:sugar phosphate isomerase/epimerase
MTGEPIFKRGGGLSAERRVRWTERAILPRPAATPVRWKSSDGISDFLQLLVAVLAICGSSVHAQTPLPTATPAATDAPALQPAPKARYRIAVCDWMILKRQKLGAFQLTKDIGADGVEVDMGSLGDRETFDNQLAKPEIRQQFLDEAKRLNLEICSLAMSGFYAQSFAERPTVPRMVQDCMDTMQAMGVKVAFLPLGVLGDLVKHPELRPVIVERLRAAGKQAEKAGVVIGIETALDAAGEVKLLDEIGSPAIKSYFNFANALQNGRDLHAELRTLGKDRICQIHCTNEDGVWLEHDPRLDLAKVKQTLDEMGWRGWLVIERSRDAKDSRNVRRNFGANAAFLKQVFQSSTP